MMFFKNSIFAIFLPLIILTGCQINIDTKPETTTSSQAEPRDEGLLELKAELEEIKKSNAVKVQELEAEVEQLKTQTPTSQKIIPPNKYAQARSVAEKYVRDKTKIKNKSKIIFETLTADQQKAGIFAQYGDGARISGYFVFDLSGKVSAEADINGWKEDCDDLYAADTTQGKTFNLHHLLCLNKKEEHVPIFIRIIETFKDTSAAAMFLTESILILADNEVVLDAFVEANKNVKPLRSY